MRGTPAVSSNSDDDGADGARLFARTENRAQKGPTMQRTNNDGQDAPARISGPVMAMPMPIPRQATRWWRFIRADLLGADALGEMKAAVAKVDLLGEPRWRDAATQDAAAAIGIVLDFAAEDFGLERFDVAMTALTVCAAEGDAAACMVVSNILRRVPGAGAAEARLATGWLVRCFRKAVVRADGSLIVEEDAT
jgi:hypothetical protein